MVAVAAPRDPHPDGYRAPYVTPIFVAVTASALWLNEYPLHSLGIPHVLVLVTMGMLLIVHEVLRPFCCTFSEICVLLVRVSWAITNAFVQYVLRGCKPKFPEWTIKYEVFQALALTAGEFGGANIIKATNVVGFRRAFDFLGDIQRWFSCRYYGDTAELFQHNGLEHMWIKSDDTAVEQQTERVVVLYYHGGGYALLSPRLYAEFGMRLRCHLAKAIAKLTGDGKADQRIQVDVLLANYRKIPDHPFPVPVDDAFAMFDYLVNEEKVPPSQIVVAGDSAGGGLTIATLLRLRDANRSMPAAALVSCPWVNMLSDHEQTEHCFISTSMLNGIRDRCVGSASSSSLQFPHQGKPGTSCLQEAVTMSANLQGLPPLFILAGEFDILHPQSLGLAETARRHGVEVELDIHSHMPHVFYMLRESMLPDSEVGVANLAAFAAKHLVPARQS